VVVACEVDAAGCVGPAERAADVVVERGNGVRVEPARELGLVVGEEDRRDALQWWSSRRARWNRPDPPPLPWSQPWTTRK